MQRARPLVPSANEGRAGSLGICSAEAVIEGIRMFTALDQNGEGAVESRELAGPGAGNDDDLHLIGRSGSHGREMHQSEAACLTGEFAGDLLDRDVTSSSGFGISG